MLENIIIKKNCHLFGSEEKNIPFISGSLSLNVNNAWKNLEITIDFSNLSNTFNTNGKKIVLLMIYASKN